MVDSAAVCSVPNWLIWVEDSAWMLVTVKARTWEALSAVSEVDDSDCTAVTDRAEIWVAVRKEMDDTTAQHFQFGKAVTFTE